MVATFNILEGDQLVSLSKAATRFPGCRGTTHVNVSTVWRWASSGCRAVDGRLVKLRVIKAGSRWFTTDSAIKEFCDSLSRPENPDTEEIELRSPAASRRASEKAARELELAGA